MCITEAHLAACFFVRALAWAKYGKFTATSPGEKDKAKSLNYARTRKLEQTNGHGGLWRAPKGG
jgi:hypothetical protein